MLRICIPVALIINVVFCSTSSFLTLMYMYTWHSFIHKDLEMLPSGTAVMSLELHKLE